MYLFIVSALTVWIRLRYICLLFQPQLCGSDWDIFVYCFSPNCADQIEIYLFIVSALTARIRLRSYRIWGRFIGFVITRYLPTSSLCSRITSQPARWWSDIRQSLVSTRPSRIEGSGCHTGSYHVSSACKFVFKWTQSGWNHKKSVFLFRLLNMAIRCDHVHRLELRKSFKFRAGVAT